MDTNDDALVYKVIAAREDERARIARDLHDRLGQHLTALRLMLEQHQVDFRSSTRATMDRALAIVREIDAELDHLAWELRPGVLDQVGLAASLRQLVQRLTVSAPLDADCRCDVDCEQLSRDQQVTIYRVAQEALHNVLKHAHATRIYVLCELRSDSLVLLVQDDSVGFEPMNRCRPSGSGLIGMNERAALAGGTLHVESSLGHGTTVFLRIPLEHPLRGVVLSRERSDPPRRVQA